MDKSTANLHRHTIDLTHFTIINNPLFYISKGAV